VRSGEGIHGAMPRSYLSRKLTRTVVVKHGRPGELKTLADARDLIRSCRPGGNNSRHGSTRQLLRAASSRAPQVIADATGQLCRALASEGWL
jgi:hypothetical protein